MRTMMQGVPVLITAMTARMFLKKFGECISLKYVALKC
jgi:hypothetical protein